MQRPPRPRTERLLHWPLLLRAYLFLGLLEASAAMAAYFFVLAGGGWRWGETLQRQEPLYLQATTACLGAIIVSQIANVFLCKTGSRSVFRAPLWNNRIIVWGIALEIVLMLVIAYTPAGRALFGTAPLDAEVWLFMLPFAFGMILLEEARKWLASKLEARPNKPA